MMLEQLPYAGYVGSLCKPNFTFENALTPLCPKCEELHLVYIE